MKKSNRSHVFSALSQMPEQDGDHIQALFDDYGYTMKWYGEIIWPDEKPDEDDFETALKLARDHVGPSMQTSISIRVGNELPYIENEDLKRL